MSKDTIGRQPSARCYHTSFYEEPYLYIYAGQGDKGRSLGDCAVLNMKTCEWKRLFFTEPPTPRHQHVMANTAQKKIKYVFGGISMPDNILYNDLWLMDIQAQTDIKNSPEITGVVWRPIQTKGEKPMPRKGHMGYFHNNNFIVFGGSTNDFRDNTSDIFALDT